MANTFGALKRVRVAERRTAFNRLAKTRLRHQIRSMRRALAAKQHRRPERSNGCRPSPLIDKAARKGYIKSSAASRYKSRLHTRVKVALGQTQK